MDLLKRIQAVQALDLHPRDKAVLVWLAFHAGGSWPRCWPSVATLAKDSGYSRRTVIDALGALAGRGLIDVQRRRSASNVYKLKLGTADDSVSADPALAGVRGLHLRGARIAPEHRREPGTANKIGLEEGVR